MRAAERRRQRADRRGHTPGLIGEVRGAFWEDVDALSSDEVGEEGATSTMETSAFFPFWKIVVTDALAVALPERRSVCVWGMMSIFQTGPLAGASSCL